MYIYKLSIYQYNSGKTLYIEKICSQIIFTFQIFHEKKILNALMLMLHPSIKALSFKLALLVSRALSIKLDFRKFGQPCIDAFIINKFVFRFF